MRPLVAKKINAMSKYTLKKYGRRKKDGSPAAGAKYSYEVQGENGEVIAKRQTDRDFTAAFKNGRNWSFVGSVSSVRSSEVALLKI